MIESIKIKNYLSIREEQEISFVASREKGKTPSEAESWFTQIGNTKLLKILIFIGNNGAGKTNVLSAVDYLRLIALKKYEDNEENVKFHPFLLDNESRNNPTEISIVYYIDDNRYTYSVSVRKDYIQEESLLLHNGRNTAYVYKRTYEQDHTSITFGNACDLSTEDKKALTVNTLRNTSVLAAFGSKNFKSGILRSNYQFFRNDINLVSDSDTSPMNLLSETDALSNSKIKPVIISMLKTVDAKINDYEVSEQEYEMPQSFYKRAPQSAIDEFRRDHPDGKIHEKEIKFKHSTSHGDYPIDLSLESRGTIGMIDMIIIICDLIEHHRCAFIDEFGYSIHQQILDLLVKLFVTLSERSQVIITTQSIAILLLKGLRRDSLRICQKTDDGETRIKPMDQTKIHKNNNLYKVYMQNELEGLPFVEQDFNFEELVQNIKNSMMD